jgi:hypothetical protein
MPTSDLRASKSDATVLAMFDPIPIHIARDRVRARIEEPAAARSPARPRLLVGSFLHRLADRVEGRTAHPRSSARPAVLR